MVLSNPTDNTSLLNSSEMAFFIIYTIELSLKLIGMGLWTKKIGFFRSGWNVLDLGIVLGSMLNIVLKNLNLNLSALRSLRVLRPLKTISSVKSLKNIILTIFSSLPFLKDIYIILFFFLFLFGITGLHLFQGVLHAKCFDPNLNSYPINNMIANSGYCDTDAVCPGNSLCVDFYSNPFFGQTSFDNVIMSTMMAFQVSTTENWSTIMYFLKSSFTSVMAVVTVTYFVLIIIMVNLVINNLMLAVIVVKFNETHKLLEQAQSEIQHSEFCNCSSGFNYAQMKVCGFFLTLSNLNLNSKVPSKFKRYVYINIKQVLKSANELEVNPDFRFLVVELLQKKEKPEVLGGALNGNFLLTLNRRKTRGSEMQQANQQEILARKSKQRKKTIIEPVNLALSGLGPRKMKESTVMTKVQFKPFDTLENKPLINEEDELQEIKEIRNPRFGSGMSPTQGLIIMGGPNSIPSSASFSFDEKQFVKPIPTMIFKNSLLLKKESIGNAFIKKRIVQSKKMPVGASLESGTELNIDADFEGCVIDNIHPLLNQQNEGYLNLARAGILNKRRNGKTGIDKISSGSDKRASFKPVVIEVDEPNNFEVLELKKDQMKAEREFNLFVNSNLDLLKLDLNYCKGGFEKFFEEMQNCILPSLTKLKIEEERQKKREELLSSKIIMFYNSKYLSQPSKKKVGQNSSQDFSSSNLQTQSINPGATMSPLQSLKQPYGASYSNGISTIPGSARQKLRLHEDISRSSNFYCYSLKASCLVDDDHEIQFKKIQSSITPINEENLRKLKPSICKHKSRNFSTITAFFGEEFDFGKSVSPEFANSENFLLYHELISDSVQKQRVLHTNWSGLEVEAVRYSKTNKSVHVFDKLNSEVYEIWLPGVIGKFNILRRHIRQIFSMNIVEMFFITMVLLNTVVLALPGLVSNTKMLDEINLVLTIIFTIEIILKFVGLGPIRFYQDIFNVFDAFIVAMSLTEVGLGSNSQILSAIKVIRVLRTVRVLRVSRVLRNLKFMRTLIRIFQITLDQFVYITLLLVLFLGIFALIGMQFYAGSWTFLMPGEVMAQNFETFFDAFLAMLDVMSIVNWNDTLVLLARTSVNYAISSVYLIVWVFVGNYILLNLFVAVLLDGFSSALILNQLEDMNNEYEGIEKAVQEQLEEQERKTRADLNQKIHFMEFQPLKSNKDLDIFKEKELIKNLIIFNYDKKVNRENGESAELPEKIIEQIRNNEEEDSFNSSEQDLSQFIFKNPRKKKNTDLIFEQIICEESLFLFPKNSFPRKYIIRMVTDPWFESFILLIIFVSSMNLVVSTWSDESWNGTTLLATLNALDFVVNSVFILECLAKIITYGFFWCEGSYLRDNWSILDFFIVCTSILDMSLTGKNVSILGVLKIVRTLRPLRVLSHNPNLKIVVQCLMQSLYGIMNVAVVVVMVWLMYAILGMNLLGGKLGFCNFPDNRSYYYVNQTMCPDLGGIWQIRGCNYENIFSGMSAVFVFSNAENWNIYTYYMMDGDDASVGPSYKASGLIAWFSIWIIFTSTFFLTKLFIGVIYSEFASEQEKISKRNFRVVSDDQIKWIQMQKMISAATPNYVEIVIPQNKLRLFLYKIVVSQSFEFLILGMIGMNMLALSIVYYDMNPTYGVVLEDLGLLFTSVFWLECVFKIISFGFMGYIANGWNKFDFLIVLVSVMDVVLTYFVNIKGVSIYPLIGRIMRILRVTRLFKIMKSKKLKGINKILKTLFYSVPAILNVSLVLVLVYFIYAVLGVFLFKGFDPSFSDFLNAFVFLFKCSTGEAWPDYMYNDETHSPYIAAIYWHSYMFLTTFTLMNLFMSVIIDQFSNFYFNADNPINSFEEIVEEFRICWLLFTSKQRGDRIANKDLLNFFVCLKSPLGFHIPVKKENPNVYGDEFSMAYFQNTLKFDLNYVRRKISEMKLLEDKQGFVSFGQVLHAALKNAFGKNCYKNTNNDTYKEIKKIELKTVAKLFNKKIENYDIEYNEQEDKAKIKARMSNPFNNVLFSQMIFQIWYNHAKAELGKEEISSDDLEDLLNKNPDRQFEKQILTKTKMTLTQNLSKMFEEDKKGI